MKRNFPTGLALVLRHEGGFVNHPKDPGGATNKGVTIGTLKRLGIDVDGDGDSDIADLKALRPADLERVYRAFYWDAVRADLLPDGVDYAVFDFAVNSGPSRAAQHLQRALGVTADGDIGPATLAAMAKADPAVIIDRIMDSRLAFLRGLKTWGTFGKGWGNRVREVRAAALDMAGKRQHAPDAPPVRPDAPAAAPVPPVSSNGLWRAILALLARIFGGKR